MPTNEKQNEDREKLIERRGDLPHPFSQGVAGGGDVHSWRDPVTGQRCAAIRGTGRDPSAELLFEGAAAREIFRLLFQSMSMASGGSAREEAVFALAGLLDGMSPARRETAIEQCASVIRETKRLTMLRMLDPRGWQADEVLG